MPTEQNPRGATPNKAYEERVKRCMSAGGKGSPSTKKPPKGKVPEQIVEGLVDKVSQRTGIRRGKRDAHA